MDWIRLLYWIRVLYWIRLFVKCGQDCALGLYWTVCTLRPEYYTSLVLLEWFRKLDCWTYILDYDFYFIFLYQYLYFAQFWVQSKSQTHNFCLRVQSKQKVQSINILHFALFSVSQLMPDTKHMAFTFLLAIIMLSVRYLIRSSCYIFHS